MNQHLNPHQKWGCYTRSAGWRTNPTRTRPDRSHISGDTTHNCCLCNPRCAFDKSIYFKFIPQHTQHCISMWGLQLGKHTHKQPPPTGQGWLTSTCCNLQLHLSIRKAGNSAGVAHTHILLSLRRIPLCNIIPLFWAQYYNLYSKILFSQCF